MSNLHRINCKAGPINCDATNRLPGRVQRFHTSHITHAALYNAPSPPPAPPPRLLHRLNTVLLNSEFHLMRSFLTVTRLISDAFACREPMLISRREPCDFSLLINRAVIGRLARIFPKISNWYHIGLVSPGQRYKRLFRPLERVSKPYPTHHT